MLEQAQWQVAGPCLGVAHECAGLVGEAGVKYAAVVTARALGAEHPEAASVVAHAPVVAALCTVRLHFLQHLHARPTLLP